MIVGSIQGQRQRQGQRSQNGGPMSFITILVESTTFYRRPQERKVQPVRKVETSKMSVRNDETRQIMKSVIGIDGNEIKR